MSYILLLLLFQQFIYLCSLHYVHNLHAFTYQTRSSSLSSSSSSSSSSLLLFNSKFIRNNKNLNTLHQQYYPRHHYQQHQHSHNNRYDCKLYSTKISWNQIPLRNDKDKNEDNNIDDNNSISSIKNKMSFLLSDNNRNSRSNSDRRSSSSSSSSIDHDQEVTVVSIDELQSYWIDKCIDDSKPEELNNFKLRHVIPMLHGNNNKYSNNTFIQLVNRTLEHSQLVDDDITVTFITG